MPSLHDQVRQLVPCALLSPRAGWILGKTACQLPVRVPGPCTSNLEVVEQGTLRIVEGTCPLDEILASPKWPSDVITQVLECTTCARRFSLGVETYHGLAKAGRSSPTHRLRPRFNEIAILQHSWLQSAVSCCAQKQEGKPHGLSIAHDSLDSDACVCWLLIVGWQKPGLAGPGCHCSVSGSCVGISSREHVHYQATSARDPIRPSRTVLRRLLSKPLTDQPPVTSSSLAIAACPDK
jgi:hypothetical protein